MARDEQQAMTSERLAELTEQFGDAVSDLWLADPDQDPRDDAYNLARQCWDDLLAEVERLREEVRAAELPEAGPLLASLLAAQQKASGGDGA